MTQELKIVDIGWIEKIPNDWNLKKVKEVYKFVSVKVSDSDYPALTVSSKYGITPQMEHVAKTLNGDARKRVEKGDFVINSRADRPGACGISAYDGSVSMICHVLKPRNEELLQEEYMHYLFRNNAFSQEFYRWGRGIVSDLWSTRKDEFGNLQVPIPPIKIQKRIGEYLKYKEQALNSLIELKVEQLEKLEQQLQSIITETVTKGLNPNVKMKDSGVEWIGEIPEHWQKTRIDFISRVKARLGWKGLKAEEYVEKGYGFLSTPNLKYREIDFKNINYITEERYLESPEIMLEIGDVLLAKDGSTLGIVNVVRDLPIQSTVNSSIAVLRPTKKINSVYFYYYLKSTYIQDVINQIKDGMGVPHLFQADIKKFKVLLPPLTEQQSIAKFLDEETLKIEKLIVNVKSQIDKLKEYRQALIYEAVTGKIDVREMEID